MSEWYFFQNLTGENNDDILSYGDMSSSVRFRTLLKARAAKVCLLCRAKVTAGDASAYAFFSTSLPHLTASYRFLPHFTDFYRLGTRYPPLGAETERISSGNRADNLWNTGASPIVKKPFQSAEIDESKRGICINTYKKAQRQSVAGLEFWTNSYGSFWWNLN